MPERLPVEALQLGNAVLGLVMLGLEFEEKGSGPDVPAPSTTARDERD